jgi:hypothetical protein
MFSLPIIVAHGSLGAFDEIIFLGVGLIFLGMMGLSWFRSRNMPAELEEPTPGENNPEAKGESPERFHLD